MKTINKNILLVEKGVIAHGVNCMGKMGAGLALAIKTKYPKVYFDYINYEASKVGNTQLIQVTPDLVVANCFIQTYYGRYFPKIHYENYREIKQPNIHCCYTSLEKCLRTCFKFAKLHNTDLYLPKIGCGLAGGDFEIVSNMIERIELEEDKESILCIGV